jgi:hypothetical protein
MFNGNLAVKILVFLSRICVTLYISRPSLKGFRLFSSACVVLAYIFLILTVFYVFVLHMY